MSLSVNLIQAVVDATISRAAGASQLSARIEKRLKATLADATDGIALSDQTPADPYTTSYDLADETLDAPTGQAVAFEHLELILFVNDSDNELTLGGGANDIDVLAAGLTVPAGGVVFLQGVFAVGVGADQITVTGTAAADAYTLIALGGDAPVAPEE